MQYKTQRGSSLIEVAIAGLIMAISVVGMLGLQSQGVRGTTISTQETQATLLAMEILDRIQANPASNVNGGSAYVVGLYAYVPSAAVSAGSNCSTNSCSNANLAAADLFEWQTRVAAMLPTGRFSITTQVDGSYIVNVMWDANRTGVTGTGCTASSGDLFCVRVPKT
jgi:type IV pilus assembly protein PilV